MTGQEWVELGGGLLQGWFLICVVALFVTVILWVAIPIALELMFWWRGV